ncbi:hypothetical protein HDU76_011795 [Blyttiomyces sp. JEL0837]|nr:hypothetical protein HDU76_011795 [Blyttiomyces sp. JEL0837]
MSSPSSSDVVSNIISSAANDPTLHIKNTDNVRKKLLNIINGGLESMHIISDFDMTMTKYWLNGSRSPSTHSILTRSTRIPVEFKTKSDEYYKKYYPIEVSHTHTYEEKYKAMEEWWILAHELIVGLKLKRSLLELMIADTPVVFREGLKDIIELCKDASVPFLVFSAGLYEDIVVGFYDPLIHVFNKNEANVEGSPYKGELVGRHNVILMGDSIGDLRMGDGLSHETTLTVGYLNHDQEMLLPQYSEKFDVVVLGDSAMDFVKNLLTVMSSLKK